MRYWTQVARVGRGGEKLTLRRYRFGDIERLQCRDDMQAAKASVDIDVGVLAASTILRGDDPIAVAWVEEGEGGVCCVRAILGDLSHREWVHARAWTGQILDLLEDMGVGRLIAAVLPGFPDHAAFLASLGFVSRGRADDPDQPPYDIMERAA